MTESTVGSGRTSESSYERTLDRFNSAEAALKYPARYGSTFRGRRERRCILKALRRLAPESSILDLPCGTGRLTPLLVGAGLRVTGADSSPSMVSLAEEHWRQIGSRFREENRNVQFDVHDVMNTGYEEGQFDAVICNRLFHHFSEAETRVKALKELNRISRGPVIVSFFNSFALDALKFRFKHALRGTVPNDRVPIPLRMFAEDLRQAGLDVVSTYAVLRGISPLCYVVAEPSKESIGSLRSA